MNEILERSDSVVLDTVRFKERIIDLIAVPWEQEADVMWRGEVWHEIFTRGAFDGIEDSSGRIPVNREHDRADTVGKVVKVDPYDSRGLIASVRIARTARGDDTLELASEGVLGGSVGYFVKRGTDYVLDRRKMLRRVKRAFLHHLAMTAQPAFENAMPVAVREGLSARAAAGEPLVTPALDHFKDSDLFRWMSERVSSD